MCYKLWLYKLLKIDNDTSNPCYELVLDKMKEHVVVGGFFVISGSRVNCDWTDIKFYIIPLPLRP